MSNRRNFSDYYSMPASPARIRRGMQMKQQAPTASFIFNWKIEWIKFNELTTKKIHVITKSFITAHRNVAFRWKIDLAFDELLSDDKFGFHFNYEDGPLSEIKDVQCLIKIMKSDDTYQEVYSSKTNMNRFLSHGRYDSCDMDIDVFKKKHGLENSDSLVYQITIKIPIEIFEFQMENTIFDPRPNWISDLYSHLHDSTKCKDWDIQLISGDNYKFFCHRFVLGQQSEGLAAMFRHASTEEEKKGVFRFPDLSHATLDVILQFLYTGKANFDQMPTTIIANVVDFAEQYQLEELKECCVVYLWQRVVKAKDECMEVLRLADLHDLEYLKDRAMDVLAEKYEEMDLHSANFWQEKKKRKIEGNVQMNRLRDEFNLYVYRRVEASLA